MKRATLLAVAVLAVVTASGYGQVWVSDFNTDGGFDGMTEFQNGNAGKDLFDPSGASGGRLVVQTQDGLNFGGVHDKGGRLLGAPANMGTNSVSAYYKFNWDQLAETAADVASVAGFLGDGQVHISRESVGTLMRFRKIGADYQVNLGLQFGGVGISNNGYKGGSGYINLGPNAIDQEMQLVVSWDAPTRVVEAALYDINGVLLGSNSGDLDTDPGFADDIAAFGPATLTNEINATNVKYLGWQDYLWNVNNQTILWDVDRVAFYGDATGAYGAVVPEPGTALMLAGAAGLTVVRRRRRA